ncbi:MAG: hypothetical protein J6T10_25970 [Methanobrevibacter sp.]|nr:hypothetical protein [Methanobrevibacter sp.]
MNREQCIDELIMILKHKLDKYINYSVIRYDIEYDKLYNYLIISFDVGFIISSCKVKSTFRIDDNIKTIIRTDMFDSYTDAILNRVINGVMEELKTFIFYRNGE